MKALERAKALHQHARHCGAPLHEFVLELTASEAFEALDWMANDPSATHINQELLRFDLAAARAANNPWPIMDDFQINGFSVIPRAGEVH